MFPQPVVIFIIDIHVCAVCVHACVHANDMKQKIRACNSQEGDLVYRTGPTVSETLSMASGFAQLIDTLQKNIEHNRMDNPLQ